MYELLSDFLLATGVMFWVGLVAILVLFKLEFTYEEPHDADTRK